MTHRTLIELKADMAESIKRVKAKSLNILFIHG